MDVDECASGEANCGPGGRCSNEPGGFRCLCETGFEFDTAKGRCVDVDECRQGETDPCQGGGSCVNTRGSFTCTCPDGSVAGAQGGCVDARVGTCWRSVSSVTGQCENNLPLLTTRFGTQMNHLRLLFFLDHSPLLQI